MAFYRTRVQDAVLHALLLFKLLQGETSVPLNGATPFGESTDGNIAVRHGVLFQTEECPWAISKAEMVSRKSDDSIRGNSIKLKSQCRGRTGNRFVNLSQYLAMGYCCRSKLLELPLEDKDLSGAEGDIFISENHYFDFSTVNVLPLEEFRRIAEDSDICPPSIELGNKLGYQLHGIHQDLLSCMNRVYLRGCETAYLGRLVDTLNFCPVHETPLPPASPLRGINAASGLDSKEAGEGSGSLVLHIRSGDIFYQAVDRRRYGQPPLQFYLDAIDSKPWSEVSVLTYSMKEDFLSPTYTVLNKMNKKGLLGPNVHFYKNRPFKTDLEAMLCAEGIAFARSSLALFISAHGRASYFYIPWECGPGTYLREDRTNESPKIVQDNTTLLAIEKPNAQVYGIEWTTGREAYSVYTSFNNTPEQRMEMLTTESVKGRPYTALQHIFGSTPLQPCYRIFFCRTLELTEYESIETTVKRTRRLLRAGTLIRADDRRLPKFMVFGAIGVGTRGSGVERKTNRRLMLKVTSKRSACEESGRS